MRKGFQDPKPQSEVLEVQDIQYLDIANQHLAACATHLISNKYIKKMTIQTSVPNTHK